MPSQFLLQIVTPEGMFFENLIHMVIVSTVEGDIGILKNHVPLVAPLGVGSIRIFRDKGSKPVISTLVQGFLFVHKDKVVIVTDDAEWADEINLQNAKEELEDLERQNAKGELHRTLLLQATNRIKIAEKVKH